MQFGFYNSQGRVFYNQFNIVLLILLLFSKSFQCNSILTTKDVAACPEAKGSPTATVKDLKITFLEDGGGISAVLKGVVTKTLNGGKVHYLFTAFGERMYEGVADICSMKDGKSTCPFYPGEFTVPINKPTDTDLSSFKTKLINTPGLDIQASLQLDDEKGNRIGCNQVFLVGSISAQQDFIVIISIAIIAAAALITITGVFLSGSLGAASSAGAYQVKSGPTPSLECVVSVVQGVGMTRILKLKLSQFMEEFSENFTWIMGAVKLSFVQKMVKVLRSEDISGGQNLTRRDLLNVPDPSATNYSELSGVESYARKIGLDVRDYFITVAFIVLCVLIGFTVLFLILRIVLEILSYYKPNLFSNVRNHFALYYVGNLLRVFLLCYFILATAAMYQLTIKDYWVVTFFAVVVLVLFCLGLVGFIAYRVTRAGPTRLYSNQNLQTKYGALYSDYRAETYTFFLPVLISAIARAIAVGALSNYVYAQMSILIITEVVFFGVLFYYRPYAEKVSNNLMVFIGVMRIMNTALLFAFIETANIKPVIRNILGFVLAAVQALMILALIAMILWSLGSTIYRVVKGNNGAKSHANRSSDSNSINSEHSLVRQHDKKEESQLMSTVPSSQLSLEIDAAILDIPDPIPPPQPDGDSYFPSTLSAPPGTK